MAAQDAMTRTLLPFLLSSALLSAGCGDDGPGGGPGDSGTADAGPILDDSRPECENVNPHHCLLPWPSSRYLAEDSATETGWRIDVPIEAMPSNIEDVTVDPSMLSRFDGFSPIATAVTLFPGRLDTSVLPDEHHIADSLADDSPTVLLDAETGERVGHFSEVDAWPRTDRDRAPLYVRPAIRLKENHRYIVAIRGLRLEDGSAVEPSLYFRALRDGISGESAEVDARRAHFEDIFTILEGAGVERSTLLEAWDFRTASGQSLWGDLVSARDQALEIVGERGLGCTVESVEEDVDEHLFRRVEGTVTVPLFLDSAEPGGLLVRNDDGTPRPNGTAEVPFKLHIPRSVAEDVAGGGEQGRLLTYGHGMFGSRHEIDTGWLRSWQNEVGLVTLATDWIGMSDADIVVAGDILTEMSGFPKIPERLVQAIVNFIVMTRSFAGVCSELAEVQVDGTTAYDTEERYFLGISEGGIFGLSLAGVSPDIERFILSVGGVSYPIMWKRSTNSAPYQVILDTWYRDEVDADVLLAMSTNLWDLADPATYAPHVVHDPLPGTPAKRILYQTGWYDPQVPNISSDIGARTMRIPLMVPTVRDVWNIEETEGPADSAYVQYKIDGVEGWEPGSRSPPGSNPSHEGVRRNPAAQQQMDAFMRPDGVVTNYCDGACDPE